MLEPDVIFGMPKRIYDVVKMLLSKDKKINIKDTSQDKED